MKSIKTLLSVLLCATVMVSCGGDKDEVPESTVDLTDNIVGTWLLSTSDAENWAVYELTSSARINAETRQGSQYDSGTGFYSINNDKFTGSYINDLGKTIYIDWIATSIRPFEISLKVYDENTYVGEASLYRVLSNLDFELGDVTTPDYRGICGASNTGHYTSLDSSIVEVDANTGEITCKKAGATFVKFNTPNGIAAIKISVIEEIKTFAEMIIGSWVYDVPAEKDWERFTYSDNGYVFAQWTLNYGNYESYETAQAKYKIEDETVSFTIKLDIGQMRMKMVTETINEFNWTYTAYDGNYMNGTYTVQKILDTVTLSPGSTVLPDYQALVKWAGIIGYKSHDEKCATVSANGEIKAKAKGRTYIDVTTNKGTGVIEVNVEG